MPTESTTKRIDLNFGIEADVRANEGADAASPRKRCKPRIDKLIAEAERAGKHVTSVTTPEGFTLNFGEASVDQISDLNNWMAKRRANQA